MPVRSCTGIPWRSLLWRWEEQKSGGGRTFGAYARSWWRLVVATYLERGLWRLAYEAHAEGPAGEAPQGVAGIGELKLLKTLAALKDNDHGWAPRVIEAIKLRAGLLLELTPGVFSFPHRTFQEYLADAYLASEGDFARQAARLAGEGARWREVILLAVGRLVYVSGNSTSLWR